jgi:arylsulfatase
MPKLYNLRADPFEEADISADYWSWRVDHMFIMVPVQELIASFMATFKEYPPSQKVGSWTT